MDNNIAKIYFIVSVGAWVFSLVARAYKGESGLAHSIWFGALWPITLVSLLLKTNNK